MSLCLSLCLFDQVDFAGSTDPLKRFVVVVTPKYVDLVNSFTLERFDRVTMLLGPLVSAKLECGALFGKPERLFAVDEEGEVQTMLLHVRTILVDAHSC